MYPDVKKNSRMKISQTVKSPTKYKSLKNCIHCSCPVGNKPHICLYGFSCVDEQIFKTPL